MWCKKLNIKPRLMGAPAFILMPVGFCIDLVHFTILRKIMPLLSTYTVNSANHDLYFVSDKAVKEIGYKQRIGFEEAVERTWQWYKNLKKD